MPHHGGQGHRVGAREVTARGWTADQALDQVGRRVGERLEHSIERLGMVRHVLKHREMRQTVKWVINYGESARGVRHGLRRQRIAHRHDVLYNRPVDEERGARLVISATKREIRYFPGEKCTPADRAMATAPPAFTKVEASLYLTLAACGNPIDKVLSMPRARCC